MNYSLVQGECGLRGGYAELANFDPQVKAIFFKMLSAKLCSTVLGQVGMDCVVKPPQPGEPSYELFAREKEAVLSGLKQKAEIVARTFNSIPGFSCNSVAGAMYAFPRIELPQKAIEKAKSLGQHPDFFYVMSLLESTGVCIVPGKFNENLVSVRRKAKFVSLSFSLSISPSLSLPLSPTLQLSLSPSLLQAPASARNPVRSTSGPRSCRRRSRCRT